MSNPVASSAWFADMFPPCDPKIFRRALDVWHTGAEFPLRKRPVSGPGYVLADIPINRSAMATTGFLRARGVASPQAYLMRIMHMYEVMEECKPGGLFEPFTKPSDEDGCILLSGALLDAVALTPVPIPADPAKRTEGAVLDLHGIARAAQAAHDSDDEGAA